jgi:hypothetical protein
VLDFAVKKIYDWNLFKNHRTTHSYSNHPNLLYINPNASWINVF